MSAALFAAPVVTVLFTVTDVPPVIAIEPVAMPALAASVTLSFCETTIAPAGAVVPPITIVFPEAAPVVAVSETDRVTFLPPSITAAPEPVGAAIPATTSVVAEAVNVELPTELELSDVRPAYALVSAVTVPLDVRLRFSTFETVAPTALARLIAAVTAILRVSVPAPPSIASREVRPIVGVVP